MSEQATRPVMVKRPRQAHNDTVALIQQIARDANRDTVPTMGTVTSVDGQGRPIVHIDGERVARTVPFPAKDGQEYRAGMRVRLSKTQSGAWQVTGSVGGGRVVNSGQLVLGSVNNQIIGSDVSGRITTADSKGQQGINAAATAQNRADQGVSNAATAQSAANTAQSAAQQAQSRADSAFSLASAAVTQAQLTSALAGKANSNHNHGEYADREQFRCVRQSCSCASAC